MTFFHLLGHSWPFVCLFGSFSVGGIMAFLTLHEMLPLAFQYAGHKVAIASVFIGMAVMSASLQFLATSLPDDVAI